MGSGSSKQTDRSRNIVFHPDVETFRGSKLIGSNQWTGIGLFYMYKYEITDSNLLNVEAL